MAGALDQRGYRPRRGERTCGRLLYRCIDGEVRQAVGHAAAVMAWEMIWGVPCGPTMSQVDGKWLGIGDRGR
jgi:hypothetical protein